MVKVWCWSNIRANKSWRFSNTLTSFSVFLLLIGLLTHIHCVCRVPFPLIICFRVSNLTSSLNEHIVQSCENWESPNFSWFYTLLHLLSNMSIISRDSTLLYLQFHFGFLKLLHNNFKGDFFQSRETALIWRQGFKRDPQHCKIILVDDHGVTNTFKLNDSWWSLVKIRSLFDHQSRGAPSSNQ